MSKLRYQSFLRAVPSSEALPTFAAPDYSTTPVGKLFAGEVLAMEAMERSTGRFCSKCRDVQLVVTSGENPFNKDLKGLEIRRG